MAVPFILLLCYFRTRLVRVTTATGGEGLAVSRWFLCAESLNTCETAFPQRLANCVDPQSLP